MSSAETSPGLSVVPAPEETFKWTPIRERFCVEYLVDFNGADAYRRAANYTTNDNTDGAKQRAYELLEMEPVRRRIAESVKEANDKTRLQIHEVEEEIKALATSDVGEMFDLTSDELKLLPMRRWPTLARRTVASIKAKKYPAGHMAPLSDEDLETAEAVVGGWNPGSPGARVLSRLLQAYKDARYEEYVIVEIKLWDKNSALEKAGKILKMFTEILEHRGIITFAEVTRKVSPEEWVAEFREEHPLERRQIPAKTG